METALKARASPTLSRSGKEKLFSIMFQIKLWCTTWQLHEELTSGVTSASGSQSNLYLFPFCSNFWHTGGLSILMNFFFECFTAFAISWNFKKTACYTPQWKEAHLQSTLLGALFFFYHHSSNRTATACATQQTLLDAVYQTQRLWGQMAPFLKMNE